MGRCSREHPEENESLDVTFKESQVVGNTKFGGGFLNLQCGEKNRIKKVEVQHLGMET